MSVPVPSVTRPEPPVSGDERAMVSVWLDYQRATLLWKCEGVGAAGLVRQSVPPSTLSLLGLVRHMTYVEWHWFEHSFAGSHSPEPISTAEDLDADFNDLHPERVAADFGLYQHQCEVSRRIAASADSLDVLSESAKAVVSLRWIMIHMIEEYARHNGHADLIREQIDGAVGE